MGYNGIHGILYCKLFTQSHILYYFYTYNSVLEMMSKQLTIFWTFHLCLVKIVFDWTNCLIGYQNITKNKNSELNYYSRAVMAYWGTSISLKLKTGTVLGSWNFFFFWTKFKIHDFVKYCLFWMFCCILTTESVLEKYSMFIMECHLIKRDFCKFLLLWTQDINWSQMKNF